MAGRVSDFFTEAVSIGDRAHEWQTALRAASGSDHPGNPRIYKGRIGRKEATWPSCTLRGTNWCFNCR